jgi:pyochelin biosynthesis protein PchC
VTNARDWFRCYQPRKRPTLRLLCLPHAGGTASSYRSWPALAPDTIEVHAAQYPGREDRIKEPFVCSMQELATQIASAALDLADVPIALFGHSLGGAIAYEVALLLQSRGVQPVHLIVSGREPAEHCKEGNIHVRDEAGIKAELLRLSEANRFLVDDAELWKLVLPIVRNDYRVVESYRPELGRKVSSPLTVFLGDADGEVTPAEARDWERSTSAEFSMQIFPGDHFFLASQRTAVVEAVVKLLKHVPRSRQPVVDQAKRWPSTP